MNEFGIAMGAETHVDEHVWPARIRFCSWSDRVALSWAVAEKILSFHDVVTTIHAPDTGGRVRLHVELARAGSFKAGTPLSPSQHPEELATALIRVPASRSPGLVAALRREAFAAMDRGGALQFWHFEDADVLVLVGDPETVSRTRRSLDL